MPCSDCEPTGDEKREYERGVEEGMRRVSPGAVSHELVRLKNTIHQLELQVRELKPAEAIACAVINYLWKCAGESEHCFRETIHYIEDESGYEGSILAWWERHKKSDQERLRLAVRNKFSDDEVALLTRMAKEDQL